MKTEEVIEDEYQDGSRKSNVIVNAEVFRRRKIVYLQRDMIIGLLSNGRKEMFVRGLPADAICIDVFYDHYREQFGLVYTSKDFEEVPFGKRFPKFIPRITLRLM